MSSLQLRMAVLVCAAAALLAVIIRLRPVYFERAKAVFFRYFNERDYAAHLAVFRIVLFYQFISLNLSGSSWFAALPAELRVPPVGTRWMMPLVSFDPAVVGWAVLAFKIACFFALIGLFSRIAVLTAVLLGIYAIGIPQCYGKVDHGHQFLLWAGLVMAVSPCGDALSLDAIIRRRPFWGAAGPEVRYARPLRMIWLLLGLAYFFPGVWKLLQGGVRWFWSDSLTHHMYAIWSEGQAFPPLRLDTIPYASRLAAIGTIFFEVGFIFFLFFPRVRWLVFISGYVFHTMIEWTMNIYFTAQKNTYLAFVNWQRLFLWVRRKSPAEAAGPVSAVVPLRQDTVMWVGGILFVITTCFGMTGITNGWPFSCFPTFGWVQGPEMKRLAVDLVDGEGRTHRLQEDQMAAGWTPHKFRGLASTILREPNKKRRIEMLNSLAAMQAHPASSEAKKIVQVRFFEERRLVAPAHWNDPPLERTLLAEVDTAN